MGLFLGASSRYAPKTIAIPIPMPAGTPLVVSTGATLLSGDAIVEVYVNTALTTAGGWLGWIDAETPVVTPVAGTTAFAFYVNGGDDIAACYDGKQFDNGAFKPATYIALTQNVSDDTKYLHFEQTANQDQPSMMYINVMR